MIFQSYKYTIRLILIGVLSFSTINILYSQRQLNQSENYEYQAPKLIAELVYSYMEIIQTKTSEINKKELSEIEKLGMIDFKNRFIIHDSVMLPDIKSFLKDEKNGWSNNCYKLFAAYEINYKKELENGCELTYILNILDKDRTVNFSNGSVVLDNHKHGILKKYNIEIEDKSASNQGIGNSNHKTNKVNQKENIQNGVEFFSWWNIALYSIILLLIALLVFIIILRINAGDKVKELENEKSELIKKISELKKIINLSIIEKSPKENEISNRDKTQKPDRTITQSEPTTQEEYYEKNVNQFLVDDEKKDIKSIESTIESSVFSIEKANKKVLENKKKYFRFPNDDGSFGLFDGQNTPESRSFYEIEFTENLGILRFRSNNSDKVILQDIYKRLFPVANLVEGSNVNSPTKIDIQGNGEAELVNNKWVITKKIKVKLL